MYSLPETHNYSTHLWNVAFCVLISLGCAHLGRKKKKKRAKEVVETVEKVEEIQAKKDTRTAAQKAFAKVHEQRVSHSWPATLILVYVYVHNYQ